MVPNHHRTGTCCDVQLHLPARESVRTGPCCNTLNRGTSEVEKKKKKKKRRKKKKVRKTVKPMQVARGRGEKRGNRMHTADMTTTLASGLLLDTYAGYDIASLIFNHKTLCAHESALCRIERLTPCSSIDWHVANFFNITPCGCMNNATILHRNERTNSRTLKYVGS